ncbi:hypothetical protein OCU04_009153 [Sclerotinia nivalis]|uniref:Uncharacterized protein n=1 Tax=Sclerotinia nivalis TaxID=352851 RepID=A0A9X0AGX6_9HELO|nr:hypothetical protein OCU04_009153 [Sclerotinia nivalis]
MTASFDFSLPVEPETALRNAFQIGNASQTENATCREYALDEIREDENEHDVLIYIRTRTKEIFEEYDEISSQEESSWLGEESIRELCRRSGRLFIYAAVVCR